MESKKFYKTAIKAIPLSPMVIKPDDTDFSTIEELQYRNTKLEKLVKDLRRQLENVNAELESFSYSVSHDLKTPLRIIDGYTSLLLEDYQDHLDESGKQSLGIVNREVKRLDGLLDHLVTFSRLKLTEITSRVFQMETLVKECIGDVLGGSKSENPELVVKDLPDVAGHPELLRQVWLNLIDNAVKYRKKNQKSHIVIGSYPTKKKDHIVFYVKDDGVGFDMKYADKLFGVFQRLHRDEEFEGSGLGLAIVRRIINLHGGDVWAESQVNKGSTFYFSLPDKHPANNE